MERSFSCGDWNAGHLEKGAGMVRLLDPARLDDFAVPLAGTGRPAGKGHHPMR